MATANILECADEAVVNMPIHLRAVLPDFARRHVHPVSAPVEVDSLRFVVCGRQDCRQIFFLCARCDHGDRYCSVRCRRAARAQSLRQAGRQYQSGHLRYTQIADETVGREYFEALTRIAERYELLPPGAAEPPAEADPGTLIQDAIRWIVRQPAEGPFEHKARLLVRRLETVRDELAELRLLAETASEGS